MQWYTKKSKDSISFEKESKCYELLKGEPFLPILKCAENNEIIIEKMNGLTLRQYIRKYNSMPNDFFKQIYEIQRSMFERKIYNNSDWVKLDEHYFIDDNGQIKMIDYDACDIWEGEMSQIESIWDPRKKFAFLFSDCSAQEQKESWDKIKYILMTRSIEQKIINNYYKNRVMIG